MTVEDWVKISQLVGGLTVPTMLVIILVAGQRSVWIWFSLHKAALDSEIARRADLLALLELERREKNEWKTLAFKATGITQDTVDLAKQTQLRVGQ